MANISLKKKVKKDLFFPELELRRREFGLKQRLGWEDKLKYFLYSSLIPSCSWTPNSDRSQDRRKYGGIFNLEFSQDGRKLVAACERQTILMFDPITRKEVSKMDHAHTDCVNGIKFLDSRLFASCSDDTTVAIWDVRNLSRKVSTLEGHSNWVKSVDYSPEESLLVTSAFDGRILGWDINNFTENGLKKSELFTIDGLMRTKLTPNGKSLVISTSKGFMLLVNNLSLLDLNEDRTRDIQVALPKSARRNQIEHITDFPRGNKALMIHSLQIHPQGWCALSRNTSSQNESEWTCVHDIQELDEESEDEDHSPNEDECIIRSGMFPRFLQSTDPAVNYRRRLRSRMHSIVLSQRNSREPSGRESRLHNRGVRFLGNNEMAWLGLSSNDNTSDYLSDHPAISFPTERSNHFFVRNRRRGLSISNCNNPTRLTHYIEELHRCPGFIKEVCFSPDGRLICSPYDTGIRLMMFNEHCSQLSHCVQKTPQIFHVASTNHCHASCVVSTKFSPTDCILVSGSLDGEIMWHQP